jgi:poly(A) polymerase
MENSPEPAPDPAPGAQAAGGALRGVLPEAGAGLPGTPRIVHRSDHRISRKDISEEALKVLYRLSGLGFKGYLVGGAVRDLYLGTKPKDYDVGTDAKPSRLKRIFRNCRIIGRRFRIAHVFFPGDKIVEVATFRRGEVHRINKESGVVLIDNEYGTPEEDARRRDITINGLFYDIATHAIIDYVGGVEDLEKRIVRTINDPDKSFIEDPVRMIRTLRHAARTGFFVEDGTRQAIYRNRHEISKANTSRLMEEMFKDLRGGAVEAFFRSITETHLLDVLLPSLAAQLREVGLDHPMWRRFRILDRWSREGRDASNPTLLSILLHTVLLPDAAAWTGDRGQQVDMWRTLMRNFIESTRHLRISRRDFERVSQVLISFRKLYQSWQRGALPPAMQKKPYLPEALEFLEVDLLSREMPVERVLEWKKEFVGDAPAKASRYAFGEGGFFGGRSRRRGGGPHGRDGRRDEARREGPPPETGEPPDFDNPPDFPPDFPPEQGAPHGERPPGDAPHADGRPGESGEKRRRRRRRGGRRRGRSRHRPN